MACSLSYDRCTSLTKRGENKNSCIIIIGYAPSLRPLKQPLHLKWTPWLIILNVELTMVCWVTVLRQRQISWISPFTSPYWTRRSYAGYMYCEINYLWGSWLRNLESIGSCHREKQSAHQQWQAHALPKADYRVRCVILRHSAYYLTLPYHGRHDSITISK